MLNSLVMPVHCPEGFRDRFIKDGWRGIENYYGHRTARNMRFIEQCGGLEQLQAERKAYLATRRAQKHRAK